MGARHAADPGAGLAQRVLAETVVRRLRGAEGLARALTAARVLFGAPGSSRQAPAAAAGGASDAGSGVGGSSEPPPPPPSPPPPSAADLLSLADSGSVPSVVLPLSAVLGRPLLEVAVAAGAVASKSEARRLIAGRGLSLSLQDSSPPVADAGLVVAWEHLAVALGADPASGGGIRRAVLVVRCGRKRTTLVVVALPDDAELPPGPPAGT